MTSSRLSDAIGRRLTRTHPTLALGHVALAPLSVAGLVLLRRALTNAPAGTQTRTPESVSWRPGQSSRGRAAMGCGAALRLARTLSRWSNSTGRLRRWRGGVDW